MKPGIKEMFLSIVVPVYNSYLYINQCVSSLLEQDIPHELYEIILVDDGSDNGVEKTLDSFAESHSNVVVYHKQNGGVSSARNAGIAAAKGKYIWFVDADDFVAPNILCDLKKLAETHGSDRIKLESYSFDGELTTEQVKASLKSGSLKSNVPYKDVMATRTLYKLEYLLKNEILFLEGVHYGEDGVFNYQTLIHNPQTDESGILAYFYRHHDASATSAPKEKRVKKSLAGSKYVFEVLVDDYNRKICLNQSRRMLLYWMDAVSSHYDVLGYEYFCENYAWEYTLNHIPFFDFELRRSYKILRKASKSRDYKKLVGIAARNKRKAQRKIKLKARKKEISGYIKHPKRLLRKMLLLNKSKEQ